MLKTRQIHKLNTTQTAQNNSKQNYPSLVHSVTSVRKRDGHILQRSRAQTELQ